jgi:hypothetical protein
MAAPNLINVTAIYGKAAGLAVTGSATAIVSNSAGSGKVLKINTLIAANISGTNGWVTVDVFKNATTAFEIAFQVTVPTNASLNVIGGSAIYLEENDSLRLTANASSVIEAVVSYEEIA